MTDAGNHFFTGLMALGIAWLFIRSSNSATTRALALAVALTAVSIFFRLIVIGLAQAGPMPRGSGWLVIGSAGAFLAAFEWTIRVRRTIPSGALRTNFGDAAIRIAQSLALFYAVMAIANPDLWAREFLPGLDKDIPWSHTVRYGFAAPLSIAMLLWLAAMLLCLRRRPDPAERVRLIAVLFSTPLVAAGLVLPVAIAPVTTTLGFFVLLAGGMRFALLQGRQGLFLSRFLSPQVAKLVSREGLQVAMRETCQPISVVSCDLRGFTKFAAARDSTEVLQLLREYYDAAGEAALEVEGTIKDYAGDGVLILVGAPVAMNDHADRSLRLARRIRDEVNTVLTRWTSVEYPLGVGVGVASGPVTVGIIGGDSRLEYAAVGTAVNLASRLGENASAGEILVAKETLEALTVKDQQNGFSSGRELQLKGFDAPIEGMLLT
ncbi:MAG: adenylate/guanylate cyclase domain-containing protein [Pseudomonadota bacterium]